MMSSVFFLTLRQLSGRLRLLILTLLAALPVIITAIVLADNEAPSVTEFEAITLSMMLAGSIAPLVVLAIAAPSGPSPKWTTRTS